MASKLITSFFNRVGHSNNDWSTYGFGASGSSYAGWMHQGGGISLGPTPDQSLLSLTGSTSGSRSILMGMGKFIPQSYTGHAPHGFGNSVLAFLSRPGVPPPFYLGAQPMATQAGSAPSASAPAATPSSNIDASTGTDEAGETDATGEAGEIAKARERYEKSRHGYTREAMQAILDAAEKAANGDADKFNDIMEALPEGPSLVDDKQAWTRDFGKWHAEYISDVPDSDIDQFVNDVASGGKATYTLTHKPKGGAGFKHYEVTEVDGTGSLKQGDSVYLKDGVWYRDEAGKDRIAEAEGTPGKTAKLTVGGKSDYLTLDNYEVHVTKNEKGRSTEVLDRYTFSGHSGNRSAEVAESIVPTDGFNYIYKNMDGIWFYKKKKDDGSEDTVPLEGAEYKNGRLYLDRGGKSYDAARADDVIGYMKDLKKADAEYDTRTERARGLEKKQREDRAKTVLKILERDEDNYIKPYGRGKLIGKYDPDTNTLHFTCDSKDCETVWKAMRGGAEKEKEFDEGGEALFEMLPKGISITFNGRELSTGSTPFKALKDAIHDGSTRTEASSEKEPANPTPISHADPLPSHDTNAGDIRRKALEEINRGEGLKLDDKEVPPEKNGFHIDRVARAAHQYKQHQLSEATDTEKEALSKKFAEFLSDYEAAIQKLEEVKKHGDPDSRLATEIAKHRRRLKELGKLHIHPEMNLERLGLTASSPIVVKEEAISKVNGYSDIRGGVEVYRQEMEAGNVASAKRVIRNYIVSYKSAIDDLKKVKEKHGDDSKGTLATAIKKHEECLGALEALLKDHNDEDALRTLMINEALPPSAVPDMPAPAAPSVEKPIVLRTGSPYEVYKANRAARASQPVSTSDADGLHINKEIDLRSAKSKEEVYAKLNEIVAAKIKGNDDAKKVIFDKAIKLPEWMTLDDFSDAVFELSTSNNKVHVIFNKLAFHNGVGKGDVVSLYRTFEYEETSETVSSSTQPAAPKPSEAEEAVDGAKALAKLESDYEFSKVKDRAKKFQQDMRANAQSPQTQSGIEKKFKKFNDKYSAAISELEKAKQSGDSSEDLEAAIITHRERLQNLRLLESDYGSDLVKLGFADAQPAQPAASEPPAAPPAPKASSAQRSGSRKNTRVSNDGEDITFGDDTPAAAQAAVQREKTTNASRNKALYQLSLKQKAVIEAAKAVAKDRIDPKLKDKLDKALTNYMKAIRALGPITRSYKDLGNYEREQELATTHQEHREYHSKLKRYLDTPEKHNFVELNKIIMERPTVPNYIQ